MTQRAVQRRALATAALAACLVAGLGALMTDTGAWYRALEQPAWKPPDWAFGPGWTLIFGLTVLAASRAWVAARTRATRQLLLAAFLFNAALNVLWSALFFRLRRPDWALAEGVGLWLSVVVLLVSVHAVAPRAAVLLWPYLAWVSFALALNAAVVAANGPFG